MTLDNEHQRKMLLELINGSTVPGHSVELAAALKAAIAMATVVDPAPDLPGKAKAAPKTRQKASG